jgi:hypothetical protein
MENASKALIIAGAILLAILIISLGIMIYNQASGVVNNNAMSEVEITQFNAKFTQYEGDNVKGTQVKSILRQVYAHNSKQDSENRIVTAGSTDKLNDILTYKVKPLEASEPDFDAVKCPILDGATYSVKCVYRESGGLVRHLTIVKK